MAFLEKRPNCLASVTRDSLVRHMRDSTFLTPAAAAERAGCGRTKIMKALSNRNLPGVRNNQGRWQIRPDDLDVWIKDNVSESVRVSDGDTVRDIEISALKAEVAMLRERVEDLKLDRDNWRQLVEKLSEANVEFRQPVTGLLARIFGRS